MSPDAECRDSDGEPEPLLGPEELPGVFRSHADAVNRVVDSLAEEIELDGEPSVGQLDSVRTEVRELESAIEDLGAGLCDDADPWEHVDEFRPSNQ